MYSILWDGLFKGAWDGPPAAITMFAEYFLPVPGLLIYRREVFETNRLF